MDHIFGNRHICGYNLDQLTVFLSKYSTGLWNKYFTLDLLKMYCSNMLIKMSLEANEFTFSCHLAVAV